MSNMNTTGERNQSKCDGSVGKIQTYEDGFDFTSPRPPLVGEESAHVPEKGLSVQQRDWHKHKSSSNMPRKYPTMWNDSNLASCGYEPEGSVSASPPAYCRWAESLRLLLDDEDGVRLFYQYLESEGSVHVNALHFWFACEGLPMQNEENLQCLIRTIYRKFVKTVLPISEELRKEIVENMKSPRSFEPPITLFNKAQSQIENLIKKTTYPNFLESDIYLEYVRSFQNPSSGSGEFSNASSSSSSTRDLENLTSSVGHLPTLHEDQEFVPSPLTHLAYLPGTSASTGYHTPNMGNHPIRLTKDVLLMSQKHRAIDVQPKSEAYAGLLPYRNVGSHAAYNSYNPVSRQDSEKQSISSHSDARTDSDNLSMTDVSAIDGASLRRSHQKSDLEYEQVKKWAALNRETEMTIIPRTQTIDKKKCGISNMMEHYTILKEKLEIVKRKQESNELLERKLKDGESTGLLDRPHNNEIQQRALENAIRDKLLLEESDQDILDQHVSRVFSDLTPAMSPEITSPRAYSPPRNRHVQNIHSRSKRRDRDGFSTFSGDSGNIHDFADDFEHRMMVKSRSVPDYADDRYSRGSASRRSSRRTLNDLTDSGVSVLSDAPPSLPPTKSCRVMAWLVADKNSNAKGCVPQTHSEMSMKHRSSHRTTSAISPTAGRHRGSNSLERSGGVATGVLSPVQPFVIDPSIEPPPPPNTTVQLEETRRRLERMRPSNKYYPDISQSSQSTLRKSTKGPRPLPQMAPAPYEECTIVVFSFADEQFPYRIKIPGTQITFKQFKEYLPKKGNYRFFFKTICEDLGNQVIQEEVNRDSDILPLWEGKIMAVAKPVD